LANFQASNKVLKALDMEVAFSIKKVDELVVDVDIDPLTWIVMEDQTYY
jgi:hypothetical protein